LSNHVQTNAKQSYTIDTIFFRRLRGLVRRCSSIITVMSACSNGQQRHPTSDAILRHATNFTSIQTWCTQKGRAHESVIQTDFANSCLCRCHAYMPLISPVPVLNLYIYTYYFIISLRQAHPNGTNQTDYAHASSRAPAPALPQVGGGGVWSTT
jgi:hypothetical protein